MNRRELMTGAAGGAVFVAGTDVAAGRAEPPSVRRTTGLAPLLQPYLAKFALPALAAAVIVKGRVAAAGVAGVRRSGTRIPVALDDRFHIGSDTKAMTALLAAMLVEGGKLGWTSTVAESFPELSGTMDAAVKPVTLEQLLSHTSGIPSDNVIRRSRSSSRSAAPARAAARATPIFSAASTTARCSGSKSRTNDAALETRGALHRIESGDGGAGRRIAVAEDAPPRIDDLLLQPIGLVMLADLPQYRRKIAHRGERVRVFLAPDAGHRGDHMLQQVSSSEQIALRRDRTGQIVDRAPAVAAVFAPDFGRQFDDARLHRARPREIAQRACCRRELAHRLQRIRMLFAIEVQPRRDDRFFEHPRRRQPTLAPQQLREVEHRRERLRMLAAEPLPQFGNPRFLLSDIAHLPNKRVPAKAGPILAQGADTEKWAPAFARS